MVELNTLGAVIKTAYEGENDTNAFTDAQQTKLAGIAAGAEVNPVNVSELTNDSGFLTTVNEAAVTAHQAALSITESQISDLGTYLTTVVETDVTAHEAALSIMESQISDLKSYVESDPTGVTGADQITNAISLTQAEYDAITTPDAMTLYYITDA